MTNKELDAQINWFKDLLEVHDKGEREVERAAIVEAIKMYERQKEEKR